MEQADQGEPKPSAAEDSAEAEPPSPPAAREKAHRISASPTVTAKHGTAAPAEKAAELPSRPAPHPRNLKAAAETDSAETAAPTARATRRQAEEKSPAQTAVRRTETASARPD